MEEPFAQHAWQTVMVGHIWVAVMMSIRSSTRLPTATSRLCRAQTRCAPHLSNHSPARSRPDHVPSPSSQRPARPRSSHRLAAA